MFRMIKPVRFSPTEYGYVWHCILLYQFVVLKEHTPYACAWIAKPSYFVCTQFLLQYVAPTLGLITCTETVSKKSYTFHAFLHSSQNSVISGKVFKKFVCLLLS